MNAPAQQLIRLDAREFVYDRRANRYRYADSGRFLSEQAVKSLTRGRIKSIKSDLGTLGDLLVQRKISLATWEEATARTLKELYIENLLLGRGGLKNTFAADYTAVGRLLRQEYRYLQGVSADLRQGTMTAAQFRARMNLYANKSRAAFELGRQRAFGNRGEMRRLLGLTSRHCSDCLFYASRGWQPVGDLPLPTERCQCGPNCDCRVEYRDLSDRLPIAN